jgi:Mg-chelatase subunit ChlD
MVKDASGNIHVVWLDNRAYSGSISEVYYKKYSAGIGWGLDTRLTFEMMTGVDAEGHPIIESYDKATPGIVVDSSGNLFVYYENITTQQAEVLKYTAATSSWDSIPTMLGDGGILEINPVLAVDSSDDIHAVWRSLTTGNQQIFYRKYTLLTGWGISQQLTTVISEKKTPNIIVDSSDTLQVAWADSRDTTGPTYFEIYYKKKPAAGSWTADTRLSFALSSDSLKPYLCSDSTGNLHLVWEDDRDGNVEIYYLQWSSSSSSWDSEVRLTSESSPSKNPRVAVDSSGQLHVIWQDGRYLGGTGWNQFSLYYKKKTAFWGDDVRISRKGCRASIIADTASFLHVAYMAQFEAVMNPEIYYLKFDPTVTTSPSPKEVVLVLDVSGSMSWQEDGTPSVVPGDSRLYKAGQAISNFLDRFHLRNPSDVNFGLVTFPNSNIPCPSAANIIPGTGALWALNDSNRLNAINTIIPGLVAGGGTPMVEGLTLAKGLLSSTTATKMLLLSSDGYHNCPSLNFPSGFLSSFTDPVYTVGIGTAVQVDLSRLANIATTTGGEFRDATTSTYLNLMSWFKTIIQSLLGLEAECDPSGQIKKDQKIRHEIWITDYDTDIAFDLSWTSPKEGCIEFSFYTPDGRMINAEKAKSLSSITHISRETYQIYYVTEKFLKDIKRAGQWTIELKGGEIDSDLGETYFYGVLMDSKLKLIPEFNRVSYYAGRNIGLQVVVLEEKKRLPANIKVMVQRPRQSSSNWMAKHRIRPNQLGNIPKSKNNDSLSNIQRKALLLQEKFQKPFSPDPEKTVFILYDDGTNGDLKANDHIYTSIISSTRIPGTYVFDIIAHGTTASGQDFRREKVIQKYLRVKPEEEYTIVKLKLLESDIPGSREYQVTITPRDALNNYLGPGFADRISFFIKGARFVETIRDHLNGSYSQRFQVPVTGADEKIMIKARVLGVVMIFCF